MKKWILRTVLFTLLVGCAFPSISSFFNNTNPEEMAVTKTATGENSGQNTKATLL